MRTDLILFACLTAAVAWCVVLTVAAKGCLRRLDRAEATVARQRAALDEATQRLACAGLTVPAFPLDSHSQEV